MNEQILNYFRQLLEWVASDEQFVSPNPKVACMLLTAEGVSVSRGLTQATGGDHAEVVALKNAQQQGISLAGGVAVVTLEPCSHYGGTPPCTEALIRAGLSKVCIINKDPNPVVNGAGVEQLRRAGLEVFVLGDWQTDHPLVQEARALNRGFFSRMERRRPYVSLKAAISLDGFIALPSGESQWITGDLARLDVHQHLRARACAVLTGVGTVLKDNPRLDVRHGNNDHQPKAIILDSHLKTPECAAIFKAHKQVLLYSLVDAPQIAYPKNAKIIRLPNDGVQPCIDLQDMLKDLAKREINDVLVEAGARLNGAFLQTGLLDELYLYVAPKLLGHGKSFAEIPLLNSLADARLLKLIDIKQLGDDLRLHYLYNVR